MQKCHFPKLIRVELAGTRVELAGTRVELGWNLGGTGWNSGVTDWNWGGTGWNWGWSFAQSENYAAGARGLEEEQRYIHCTDWIVLEAQNTILEGEVCSLARFLAEWSTR